jgi:hypothetical protein
VSEIPNSDTERVDALLVDFLARLREEHGFRPKVLLVAGTFASVPESVVAIGHLNCADCSDCHLRDSCLDATRGAVVDALARLCGAELAQETSARSAKGILH